MSMMRALDSGVAGLKNYQTGMDNIANNISNVNTTGFKASRTSFQSMLSQTLQGAQGSQGNQGGTNPVQIGLGMSVASIDTVFTTGSLQSTGKSTDLAVSGEGFFIVQNGSEQFYTRNGAFDFDNSGNYVIPGTGSKVMGWLANADGIVDTSTATVPLVKPTNDAMAAKQSTTTTLTGNLNANTVPGMSGGTSTKIYDSLGNSHNITNTYYKANQVALDPSNPAAIDTSVLTNTWIGAKSVEGATSGTLTNQYSMITFNTDGSLKSNVTITPCTATSSTPLSSAQVATISNLKMTNTGTQYMGFTQIDNLGNLHSFQMSLKYNDTTSNWSCTVTEPSVSSKELYTDTVNWDGTKYAFGNSLLSAPLPSEISYTDDAGVTNTITLTLDDTTCVKPDANNIAGYINAPTNIESVATEQKDLTFSVAGAKDMTINTKISSITQAAASSGKSSLTLTQDGYEAGSLSTVSFTSTGTMTGTYSNGQIKALGQVALATFSNAGGLTKVGSTLFAKSTNSGDPQVGTSGTGGKGTIVASNLEGSNVDLTEQFSEMIKTQRAFQSNSKIVTTSDTMIEELINLKR